MVISLTLIISLVIVRLFNKRSLMAELLIAYCVITVLIVYIMWLTNYKNIDNNTIFYTLLVSYMILVCLLTLHFAIEKPSISMNILLYCWIKPRKLDEVNLMLDTIIAMDNRLAETDENKFLFKNNKLRNWVIITLKIWKIVAPIEKDTTT